MREIGAVEIGAGDVRTPEVAPWRLVRWRSAPTREGAWERHQPRASGSCPRVFPKNTGDDSKRVSGIGRTGGADLRGGIGKAPKAYRSGKSLYITLRRQGLNDGFERSANRCDAVALRSVVEVAQYAQDSAEEPDDRCCTANPTSGRLPEHAARAYAVSFRVGATPQDHPSSVRTSRPVATNPDVPRLPIHEYES